MMPDRFPESNKILGAPRGMQDSCDPLAVWTDGKVCISRWRLNWRERIAALLFGRVWLRVYSGATQPPVAMSAERTVFVSIDVRTWWVKGAGLFQRWRSTAASESADRPAGAP